MRMHYKGTMLVEVPVDFWADNEDDDDYISSKYIALESSMDRHAYTPMSEEIWEQDEEDDVP